MHECASIAVTNLRVANTPTHTLSIAKCEPKLRLGPKRIVKRLRRYAIRTEQRSRAHTPLLQSCTYLFFAHHCPRPNAQPCVA